MGIFVVNMMKAVSNSDRAYSLLGKRDINKSSQNQYLQLKECKEKFRDL